MSETTNTEFSYKQQLIQLHQVLAEARIYCKKQFGEKTDIEELDGYDEIGITSINLDADIDKQLDAVLALSNELADTLSVESQKKQVSATGQETVTTTLFDVTEDGIDTEAKQVTVEHNGEAEEDENKEEAETVNGEYGDTGDVEMIDTSILASWSEVRQEEELNTESVETINPNEWEYDNDEMKQTSNKEPGVQETVNAY